MTSVIKLNVGGKKFVTLKETLLECPWFEPYFSGKFRLDKVNGDEFFIDRNPEIFKDVLAYLRNGKNIHLSHFRNDELRFNDFVKECDYFGITVQEKWPLKDKCTSEKKWVYEIVHGYLIENIYIIKKICILCLVHYI